MNMLEVSILRQGFKSLPLFFQNLTSGFSLLKCRKIGESENV